MIDIQYTILKNTISRSIRLEALNPVPANIPKTVIK